MASLIKRNGMFYLQWRTSRKIRRRSLQTQSLQLAKEQLRQFESARLRGVDDPTPTRTPIADIVSAYVEHIRTTKTPKSAQIDVYYLREAFGVICPALEITSRKVTAACKKRPPRNDTDRRLRNPVIDAPYLEAITTADVSAFITAHTRARGLAPKTANRYREIIVRLFNWAMQQRGIRMPGDRNPAAKVERYREPAPEIRYLTLSQIDEQLTALRSNPQLQAMVATLIYAGLRREELVWLTCRDIDFQRGQHGFIYIRAKSIADVCWQPKTRKNRAIPISSNLRTILNDYAPRPSVDGWYFPSPQGLRWDPDNFSSDLRRLNSNVGLPWSCLDYRHTFGSSLAQNGVSLFQIATLMGNSPDICRRHYAALVPELLASCVEFGRAT